MCPPTRAFSPARCLLLLIPNSKSFSTVGLLTDLCSTRTVAQAVALFYEQNPDVVLPHSGTIFDLRTTLSAVARHNSDDKRVGQLWEEGKSVEMISFITGLSLSVVQQKAGEETRASRCPSPRYLGFDKTRTLGYTPKYPKGYGRGQRSAAAFSRFFACHLSRGRTPQQGFSRCRIEA